jgi:hypothetical protein
MDGDQRVIPGQNAPARDVKARGSRWFEYHKPIPLHWSLPLGIAIWVIFFGLWELAAARNWVNTLFMPPPHRVLSTLDPTRLWESDDGLKPKQVSLLWPTGGWKWLRVRIEERNPAKAVLFS